MGKRKPNLTDTEPYHNNNIHKTKGTTMTKAQKKNSTDVETLDLSDVQKVWSTKYAQCKECGTTERKHYSGGSCTRCYTTRRNARLGIGTFSSENIEKKMEYMDRKIQEMKYKLKELLDEREALELKMKELKK